MSKINLFISYSHEDKPYFDKLKTYINSENCPNLTIWDDGEIKPGTEWDQEIKTKLNQSQMVLLLISNDFLRSKYINQVELKSAFERHKEKKCRVIPIWAKNCYLNNHKEITDIQGLPVGMKFLSDLGEQVYAQYTEIQKEITELSAEMLTDANILNAIAQNDKQSGEAIAIEELRNKGKIFLSVPASEEGRKKRMAFMYQVEGKIKHEDWPYQIIPSLEETQELLKKNQDDIIAACSSHIKESVYSIHIIVSENDLTAGPDKIQYDLSKSLHADSAFHKRIVWFLNADLIEKFDKEVSMDPRFIGNDYEAMFDKIKSLDTEKEQKINEMKKAFSPNKKVFMFYDFTKDHNNELRIKLKKRIESDENIAVIPNMPNGMVSGDMQELEKCEGACIFYGSADPEWFIQRQSILYASGKTNSKAICIDEPGLEKKIERDLMNNVFITIKGENDFESSVKIFLDKLNLTI